jgi:NAD(P)-dependent dehydrogenase (short-subunit alcohol dehydrogenase family)
VARKLAADGFSVLVHGRDAAVVDEITAAGGHGRFIAADLTEASDIERLADGRGEAALVGHCRRPEPELRPLPRHRRP